MPRRRGSIALEESPEELTIRFWGVRGSVAVPGPGTVRYGGNTSCVEVRWGRDIVILDAGTGIRELGKSLLSELPRRPRHLWILITHTHWDHIQGFPFFAPAYLARQQIRILGWRGSRSGLERTVATSVESPFFPVSLPQMPSTITIRELRAARFRIGQVRGTAGRIHHPGGGVAYRLDTPAGSLAYVPDHEVLSPRTTPPASINGVRPTPGYGIGSDANSAGTRNPRLALRQAHQRHQEIRALIEGVDVLIHDAQYTPDEYATRVGWGHSCVDAVVRQAAETGVKRLLLFHHDPDHTDDQLDLILAQARSLASTLNPRLVVDAAREGLELRLKPTSPNRGSRARGKVRGTSAAA